MEESISVVSFGTTREESEEQDANAPEPIYSRVEGRLIDESAVHVLNAPGEISFTPSSSVTLSSPPQK